MADDRKKADASKQPDDEIDPDAAPSPQEFKAPKGLLKVTPPADEFDLKSGAGSGKKPAATPRPPVPGAPPGAEVRLPSSTRTNPPPPMPGPPTGEVDVRLHKSQHGPRMEDAQGMDNFEVSFSKGAAKLPKMEEPGEFDVVKKASVAEPRSPPPKPQPLEGPVEVVDYRKTGSVDLTGQVPDPFTKFRRIGIVDTTFARVDMGTEAEDVLHMLGGDLEVVRRTVPGIKDLAVEAKILIEKAGCEVVVACGMVGGQPVDKTCAHEASMAIQWAQLQTNHHVLEVFVHEDETPEPAQLAWLMKQRTREHAENAWRMVFDPQWLRERAGHGLRQGFADAGPLPTPR